MGFSDVWNRTLVYFGIAEDEEWDEDGYVTNEELERSYSERPNVRRLSPRRRRGGEFEDWKGIPSNVEFGVGDESNVLYVTIDKSLYRIRLKARGLPPPWAGSMYPHVTQHDKADVTTLEDLSVIAKLKEQGEGDVWQ